MTISKKIPFILALLSLVGGIFISILFGVNESIFKDKIKNDLKKNIKISKIMDPVKKKAKVEKEKSKNWRYYQRFHFHSTAIGSMTVALLILLSFLAAPAKIVLVNSYMLAVGGFMYPFVWLFAAMYGPILGRTEAKEAFAIFAYGGGVYLVGLILLIALVAKYPLKFKIDK
jgi:hypothetical protein